MKTRLLFFIGLSLSIFSGTGLLAEEDESSEALPNSNALQRTPEQLDQLFGPIALYPDALIALILPASTAPSDVVIAARYLKANGDIANVENEDWEDSLKSLAHYPDVVKWMDENLAWTKQAGAAFISQPADVMNSIQRLRAKARAAGTLVDTPQQQVVMEDDNITIIPAQPDVIYVPRYDPEVVYVSRPGFYDDPFLTFGTGYAAGFWLGYDFDWGRRRIWTIDRHDRERYWRERHDWHHHSFPSRPGYVDDHFHHRPWQPRPEHHRPPQNFSRNSRPDVIRPVPFSGRDHDHHLGERADGRNFNSGDRDRSRGATDRGRSSHRDNKPSPVTAVVPGAPVQTPISTATPPATFSGRPQSSRPSSPQSSARERQDRNDREPRSRERQRPAGTPNASGRIMQVQPVAQANSQPPVSSQVRSSPPPPQARSQPSPTVQSRPQYSAPSPQPRSAPSSTPGRQEREERRDRPSR